ncbi:hypothetical protein SAMN02745157_2520 [Kaistia soli DSM 19436]|uniref:Uncharacterized protein n=1 Tax=Kaistia soli DSM 19436 TaxID=1122133 RepID=A0A1M5D0N1_9HYPH|nr:hypothetical protein [Kaistia soli]SHF60362.1 hypothetical protein SAMN02745157_2520 [Kaistia soli DSM 19436]
MTSQTATRASDGGWQVTSAGAVLAGPFPTMAEAWRWIDRYEGEPITPVGVNLTALLRPRTSLPDGAA